jgi:hypothetical protein
VATSALITERAVQQVGQLRKKERRSYDQFLLALRAHGCASLNYRLSGDDLLSKICVAHLSGPLRVVVAFSAHNVATILLVGPHVNQDPFIDVYSRLYELAGLTEPPTAQRTKSPCCGKRTASPRSPIANSLQTWSAEPDSCRELVNGAHAKLRAKDETSYGLSTFCGITSAMAIAGARRRDNESEHKQSGTRDVCYSRDKEHGYASPERRINNRRPGRKITGTAARPSQPTARACAVGWDGMRLRTFIKGRPSPRYAVKGYSAPLRILAYVRGGSSCPAW